MRAIAIALSFAACSSVTTLRYRPSKDVGFAPPSVHGVATLPTPAHGTAIPAALADGFPVWVVSHEDGAMTVVGAVAPAVPRTPGAHLTSRVAGQVDRSMVAWIASLRVFYAGGVVFDERGRALGYGDFDACFYSCPELPDELAMLRDLDTFVVWRPDGRVEVGAMIAGEQRQGASTWVPWRGPATRETDTAAALSPAFPRDGRAHV